MPSSASIFLNSSSLEALCIMRFTVLRIFSFSVWNSFLAGTIPSFSISAFCASSLSCSRLAFRYSFSEIFSAGSVRSATFVKPSRSQISMTSRLREFRNNFEFLNLDPALHSFSRSIKTGLSMVSLRMEFKTIWTWILPDWL